MKSLNRNAFHHLMEVISLLGWQSMPVDVALDAIDIIVTNEQELDRLFYDTCADVEHTLMHLSSFEGKYIYRKLFPIRFELTPQEFGEHLKYVDALREEVEAYMRVGYFFHEAAAEWDLLY